MRRSHYRVLVLVGLVVGALVAGMVVAVTFDDGEAIHSENVTYQAPDGLAVNVNGTTDLDGETLFPDSSTVELNTTDGNISLAAASDARIRVPVEDIVGDWTRAENITAGPTWIEINPADKQRVEVRGDVDTFAFRAAGVDNGQADFAYSGPDGGTTAVRIDALPASQRIVAVDSNGDYLDHATTDASGTLELALPNSEHTVSLVTVDGVAPTLSDPSPTGLVPETPDELAVTVDDGDFAADKVDVTISLDGTQIHSETITEGTRVTTSNFGELDLEGHQWTVEATDSYGNTTTETYDFRLPTNITVRNELNASEIIEGANVTATFFASNGEIVVERTDDNGDGNISMRGLPDTDFVVTVDSGAHYQRRSYISSIGDQRNIYLINKTELDAGNVTETLFTYEDRTSRFEQSETTLEIQRAVDKNNDGTFAWETVAGDFWGAAGEFPFIGETNARYRLVVTNRETGDRRVLGTHIPTADGIKEIIVGTIEFDADNATGTWFDARLNGSTGNLQIQYTDPENATSDLTLRVYERGNRSNVIYTETVSGPVGTEVWELVLTEDQREGSWVVEFTDSGGNILGQVPVGGGASPLPIGPQLLNAFALSFVVFIASLYGPRTALMGAWAVVGVAGIMLVLGWFTVPVPGLVVAAAIALGATVYREASPT